MSSKEDEVLFNKRFALKRKINSGSFGVVFQGEDRETGNAIALKLEEINKEESELRSVLREASLLIRLEGIRGIPQVIWSGTEHSYDVLVMKLLGKDLAGIMKILKKMTIPTVVRIALQLLEIIEQVHERSIVHRDIKPENILIGREEDAQTVFLLDFGISKYYQDYKKRHIVMKEKKPFIGTTRYASLSSHLGKELSRRDDLESLGYVLVFLAKGKLPWQNVAISEKNKEKYVGKLKEKIDMVELCREMPEEFIKYFEYVKALEFTQKPDYELLQKLFRKIAEDNDFEPETIEWDWDIKAREKREAQEDVLIIGQLSTAERPINLLQSDHKTPYQSSLNQSQALQKKNSLPVDFNNDIKAFPLKKSQTKENKPSFKYNSFIKKTPTMGSGTCTENFLQVPHQGGGELRSGMHGSQGSSKPSLHSSLIMEYVPSMSELGDDFGEEGMN
jgi:serine/threonine protein kinase